MLECAAPGNTGHLQGKLAIAGFLVAVRGLIRLPVFQLVAAYSAQGGVTVPETKAPSTLRSRARGPTSAGSWRYGCGNAGSPRGASTAARWRPEWDPLRMVDGTRTENGAFGNMTAQPSRIEDRRPDGSFSLGAATADLTIRRFRRLDGQIEPKVGGDGLVHITASLFEGQLVEKTVGRNATKRIIAAGDVSIDRPDIASRYFIRGASDIIQISLSPEGIGGMDSNPIGLPRLDEPAPGLETMAYRVAQAIWLGEMQDALFMSSVLQSTRVLLGTRVHYPHRGGLSARNVRLVSELIEARIRPVQALSPTLAELASEAGLSVFHFTRAFRESFGLSPYRYLLRRRLGQARDMLAAGEANLRLISRRCAFSSVPHLTNTFSREMGISPARFRRILSEVERSR